MPAGGGAEGTQDPSPLEKGNSSSRSTTPRLRRGIRPCTASLERLSRPAAALPAARGKARVGVVEEALPLVLQSGVRENWAWGDRTHRSAYRAICAPLYPVPPAAAFEHWQRRGWGQSHLDQSVSPLVWWTVLSQPGPARVLKGTEEVKERANEIVSSDPAGQVLEVWNWRLSRRMQGLRTRVGCLGCLRRMLGQWPLLSWPPARRKAARPLWLVILFINPG